MWERACPRRRWYIQHRYKLIHRFREQTRSHFFYLKFANADFWRHFLSLFLALSPCFSRGGHLLVNFLKKALKQVPKPTITITKVL